MSTLNEQEAKRQSAPLSGGRSSDNAASDSVPQIAHGAGSPRTARSEEARAVLDLLSSHPRGLTLGQLRARTGLSADGLHVVLNGLRGDGLVARLNTLVESYVCRFPGIKVDDS